eukprot:768520-Hanusia_phi.AAC.10
MAFGNPGRRTVPGVRRSAARRSESAVTTELPGPASIVTVPYRTRRSDRIGPLQLSPYRVPGELNRAGPADSAGNPGRGRGRSSSCGNFFCQCVYVCTVRHRASETVPYRTQGQLKKNTEKATVLRGNAGDSERDRQSDQTEVGGSSLREPESQRKTGQGQSSEAD